MKTLSLQQLNNIGSVKIIEVVNALERFAPLPLQADFDNAGLQVGLTEAEPVSYTHLTLPTNREV